MKAWQYGVYLLVRTGFGVGAWFAIESAYPNLSQPVVRAFAASASGIILLENVSLKPVGGKLSAKLSMGDSLETWGDAIIEQAKQARIQSGKRAIGRKAAANAKIIESGMRLPLEQVQSWVKNLIAGAKAESKTHLEEELKLALEGLTVETASQRQLLTFMLSIHRKSTRKFVGQG